jgi:hypothetical protein
MFFLLSSVVVEWSGFGTLSKAFSASTEIAV